MTMKELKKFAKELNIKISGLRKAELIRTIQKAEGNFDCFGSAKDHCDQYDCLFREDCIL
ncbi:MAG: Rho termination factor N-terminal domain-containing protein [Thermodesulfobacteriota bacterium]|nr:Rho termination factor N-terminal domain-containing protein [Thermodesulfobacteriota bacterium]